MRDDIRIIAAVGQHGQIGVGDTLPWNDPEELRAFRQRTIGDHVVMGSRTFDAIVKMRRVHDATAQSPLPERVCHRFSRENGIEAILDAWRAQGRGKSGALWIAGGAATYRSWIAYCRGQGIPWAAVISIMPYDGNADSFMPQLWADGFTIAAKG